MSSGAYRKSFRMKIFHSANSLPIEMRRVIQRAFIDLMLTPEGKAAIQTVYGMDEIANCRRCHVRRFRSICKGFRVGSGGIDQSRSSAVNHFMFEKIIKFLWRFALILSLFVSARVVPSQIDCSALRHRRVHSQWMMSLPNVWRLSSAQACCVTASPAPCCVTAWRPPCSFINRARWKNC